MYIYGWKEKIDLKNSLVLKDCNKIKRKKKKENTIRYYNFSCNYYEWGIYLNGDFALIKQYKLQRAILISILTKNK